MTGVQSIERAFAILRVLADGPARLTDIAAATGLPKSTVSRLLKALEVEDAVLQPRPGGVYAVGPGLGQLSGRRRGWDR